MAFGLDAFFCRFPFWPWNPREGLVPCCWLEVLQQCAEGIRFGWSQMNADSVLLWKEIMGRYLAGIGVRWSLGDLSRSSIPDNNRRLL